MQYFDYAAPRTVDDAVALLAEHGEGARPLAGGTDLLVQLRAGRRKATRVVDVKNVEDANALSFDSTGGLTLGASVPCYRIYEEHGLGRAYPALVDSASMIGGTQIQGRASIGGNLCNAAPSADAIPSLIVHRVACVIAGPNGTREVPVEKFCVGPGRTVLQPGEMLVSLKFPAPEKHTGSHYLRFIPRNEMDIAVAGAGAWVQLEQNGTTRFKSARIALSAVAPTPLFAEEAGRFLEGKEVNEENVAQAAEMARKAAKPITDMRGTIEYRVHLVEVLTRRALERAISRAKENS